MPRTPKTGEKIKTGFVHEIDVTGSGGTGSAQLEFLIAELNGESPMTFVVLADVAPQAFAGMAALLTAALGQDRLVTVTYLPPPPEESPRALNVVLQR